MPLCNRHDIPAEMKLVGNRWVCTDPTCGWGYNVPVRISMADLVAENDTLKSEVKELHEGIEKLLKKISEMEILLQQAHRQ